MAAAPVLFVSYSGALGGAERILLDCLTRLDRPALLACPRGPLAAAARAAGIRVVPVRVRPLRLRGGTRATLGHAAGLIGLSRDIVRLARTERPPAVVAWGMRAVLAAAPARSGAPVLAVHNDLLPDGAVSTAVRARTSRCAGVVALSRAIADHLRGNGSTTILHPGVELGSPVPPLPAGPPRALWLGAIVGWKRPELALEVAARVPELRLDLAGAPLPGDGGELLERLHRRAAAPDLRGRVRLLGHVEVPLRALAGASCLLHTADAEPYGLALVEALAAGRPVVAPASGGPLEIVAGGAGRLYPPADAAAAAAALRAVLADPRAGTAARARAEAAFDVEHSAARFAAALAAVTKR